MHKLQSRSLKKLKYCMKSRLSPEHPAQLQATDKVSNLDDGLILGENLIGDFLNTALH